MTPSTEVDQARVPERAYEARATAGQPFNISEGLDLFDGRGSPLIQNRHNAEYPLTISGSEYTFACVLLPHPKPGRRRLVVSGGPATEGSTVP